MSTTDDLTRLAELHRSGDLSDDEYAQAKARVLNERALRDQPPLAGALNGLRRSRGDRWIGGVCGGLAQATGMAPWLWRLGFRAVHLLRWRGPARVLAAVDLRAGRAFAQRRAASTRVLTAVSAAANHQPAGRAPRAQDASDVDAGGPVPAHQFARLF